MYRFTTVTPPPLPFMLPGGGRADWPQAGAGPGEGASRGDGELSHGGSRCLAARPADRHGYPAALLRGVASTQNYRVRPPVYAGIAPHLVIAAIWLLP